MGLWDSTIPGIQFDENGVSNYAVLQKKLTNDFPRGSQGKAAWENLVSTIKKDGEKREYDCILGLSGGTDSSFLAHFAVQSGLNVLAVNVDNGFNSHVSLKNIKKITEKLNIDLYTYVVNYEEMKDLLRCYMMGGLPWVDYPSDKAIKSSLFRIANKMNIKYVISGTDFRTEGMQPKEWSYSDSKQLKYLHNKYGQNKLKSYPNLGSVMLAYYSRIKGIKKVLPFNYIEYNKTEAQKYLQHEYDWEYYGGHHHENSFTKYSIAHWLPNKFGIDKRKITLSAQIIGGEITRDEAISKLALPPISFKEISVLENYVIKKLDLSKSIYKTIWNEPNKYYYDYPNDYEIIVRFKPLIEKLFSKTFTSRPKSFYQIEMRERNKS